MRLISKVRHEGYFLIIAVIFIMVLGVMGVVINYMFASRGTLSVAQYNELGSFYIAESGLDIATHYLSRNSLVSAPARISCASVTGNAQLTNASLLNGAFTATSATPTFAVSTLNGAITASATTLTLTNAAAFDTEGRVIIDGEAINYAGKSGNTLTNLSRGVDDTLAANHAAATGVGQYQCSLTVTSGVPNIVSPAASTTLSWKVELPDIWVGEDALSANFNFLHWNYPTELTWTSTSLAGSSSAANINAISMLSNAYGWAVTPLAASKLNFLNWNGSAWSLAATLAGCNGQDLLGISMVSRQEGWAVGANYRRNCSNSNNYRYNIVKWDGSSWTLQVPSAIPPDHSTAIDLLAVSVVDTTGTGIGNIGFTVGTNSTILRYNGSTWSAMTSPTTKNLTLTGVSTVSTLQAWAVGESGTILRYNGSSWSTFTSPTTTTLNAIAMIDTDGDGLANFGIAVGNSGATVIYNGASWSAINAGINNLIAVAVIDSQDAWAVGQSGVAFHWNGSSWESISTGVTRSLNAISAVAPHTSPISAWRQTFH